MRPVEQLPPDDYHFSSRKQLESLSYLSPVVSGEPFYDGQLADCYSLGATIYCIKFGRPPFMGRGSQKNQKLLDLYEQIKLAQLTFPEPVDAGLKDLISSLMQKEPQFRLRTADAFQHPWLV